MTLHVPYFIVFSGLPGVGKTTLARPLAQLLRAVYLRVDSIEAALKKSSLHIHPAEDAGYLTGNAIARDNLASGLNVVADSVNPSTLTREWWAEAADGFETTLLNVEVLCSDRTEHRKRVEGRSNALPDLDLPDWTAVRYRYYESWDEDSLAVETSGRPFEACLNEIVDALPKATRPA